MDYYHKLNPGAIVVEYWGNEDPIKRVIMDGAAFTDLMACFGNMIGLASEAFESGYEFDYSPIAGKLIKEALGQERYYTDTGGV